MGSGRLAFLTARCWLDVDGYHVWAAHDCTTERVVTMLPWPTWQAVGDRVEPSISCEACGAHYFATITDNIPVSP